MTRNLRRRMWGLSAVFLLSVASIGLFWTFRIRQAQGTASNMMSSLAELEPGSTSESATLQIMKRFADSSRDATDCFGGPCLNGRIYTVVREKPPLVKWWPKTELTVGLFFSRGTLVIKRLKYGQESADFNAGLVIIENAYPFPDRAWDVDEKSGYREHDKGNLVVITIDRRAPAEVVQRAYDLNLSCMSSMHGCQFAGTLQHSERR
jgi:hypothetical protein